MTRGGSEVAHGLIRLLGRLAADDCGQDLAEYGIALGVIVAILVSIAVVIGEDVNTMWSNAQTQIDSVVNSE
jgi:Flp pilus assembly pilin Flp